jgi:hypothetical protein
MAGGGDGPEYPAVASSRVRDAGLVYGDYEIPSGEKTKGPVVFAAASRPNRREDED